MKSLILHNIISSNTVYKLNTFIKKGDIRLGETTVFFCSETEANRKWTLQEKPLFPFKVLPHYEVKILGKDLFTYFLNFTIWKELNSLNPDKIIICGWDQFAYQVSFLWAHLHHKKIFLWSGSTDYEKSWRRSITLPMVKFFVSISSNFIAYGKRSRDYLIKLGANPKKIYIFNNDVNSRYFINESKKWSKKKEFIKREYNISCKHNFIYVGQLIQRKGVMDLLKAFEKVNKVNKKIGLVIVGYGKLEPRLKKYVNDNKIANVVFAGFIEQYDLPKIYCSCECLVLPSHEEVYGLVVKESLYSGLDAIVSDSCGCVGDFNHKQYEKMVYKTGEINQLSSKMIEVSSRWK